MADRRVTSTRKDEEGDIIALCNKGKSWSPRKKGDAIRDIEADTHTYHVKDTSGRSDIHVVDGPSGKYLRTDPNGTASDNLDSLPDC
jgi:hypothetical protein